MKLETPKKFTKVNREGFEKVNLHMSDTQLFSLPLPEMSKVFPIWSRRTEKNCPSQFTFDHLVNILELTFLGFNADLKSKKIRTSTEILEASLY